MLSTALIVWMAGLLTLTTTTTVYDLRWRRIPNWLTVTGFALGVAYHVAAAAPGGLMTALHGLATALGGFAVGFGLLLLMWLMGQGGGGDVKLMGAVGAWLGFRLTLDVLVASAVFIVLGGVASLGVALLARGPIGSRGRPRRQEARRRLMPFALPVGLGTWSIVAWSLLAGSGVR